MFNLITPEQAVDLNVEGKGTRNVAYYKKLARSNKRCFVCGQPVWKLAETGLCFTCTTGEADDSNDYELISEAR